MGLDYVDLYLAHWPVVFKAGPNIAQARAFPNATNADKAIATTDDDSPVVDWQYCTESIAAAGGHKGSFKPTWQAMQKLVDSGKTRAIGVSNFNIAQLKEVLEIGGTVPLSGNQVEAHPFFPNSELFKFMKDQGILAFAYCPFAGQNKGKALVQEPEVLRIANKNGLEVGQLLQSWAVQRGTIPLGKSQTPGKCHALLQKTEANFAARIKSNLDIKSLPDEDVHAIDALDKGPEGRSVNPGPGWGVKLY